MFVKNLFFGIVIAILLGFGFLSYSSYVQLDKNYQLVNAEKASTLEKYQEAVSYNGELENQVSQLQSDLSTNRATFEQMRSDCAQTSTSLTNCLSVATQANAQITELQGNVLFKGGTATVNYHLLDGTQHSATYDVRNLNNAVNEGFLNRYIIKSYRSSLSTAGVASVVGTDRLNRFYYNGQISPVLYLKTSSGSTVNTDNYMAFEDTASVSTFANYIKQNSKSDMEFVQNVLYVKSQLNDYTYNIVGEPRYPLETFLEGGGDCGASSLFVGSMIKAAHPDWKVQLWYVNSNAISGPAENLNHAIVLVDSGTPPALGGIKVFIESTAKDYNEALNSYAGQSVSGWSYDF